MPLLSLTASHQDLDLVALERLSVGAHAIGESAVETCDAIQGAVVLATCNRFELYLDVEAPVNHVTMAHAADHVAGLIAEASGVTPTEARTCFHLRSGPDVAQHLFTVAAGLDSMVMGEREIAGQVKRSLSAAREAGVTSKSLELLFQTASRTSKQVGSQTPLGGAGRSIVALGLELAANDLPPWRQARVVLIGTGSYAGATLAALRTHGCEDVRVYSQSGRAEEFATARGAVPVSDLLTALEDADLVVSCSGARGRAPSATGSDAGTGETIGHVLDAAAVVRARARATADAGDEDEPRALVILDLALHRDVDPHVADVEGVLLYDLATLGAHSPALGSGVIGHAQQIVADAAHAFEETRLGREADAAVIELLYQAEKQVAAEVAALLDAARQAGEEPDDTDAESIMATVRRRVHSQLHPAIVAARAAAVAQARAEAAAVIADAEDAIRAPSVEVFGD